MRARGAFSSPSTTIWRYLIRPSPTQAETSRMKSPTSRPRSGTGRQAQKVRYFLDLSAARGRERISAIFALSVGRFPLQVCTQNRKPVISPKDLLVHCKGWDTEHPGLNCTFRLKTKPFFDLSCLRLAQKLLSIEADAIQ